MLGIIYTSFSDLIVERHGMAFWNRILARLQPASEGAYTTAALYDDAELLALIKAVSQDSGEDSRTLVRVFGEYLFSHLLQYYPVSTEEEGNLLDFLAGLNERVHAEVHRVHPGAYLPHFEMERTNQRELSLRYTSERRLCALAEGLIEGAARHFEESLSIEHPRCQHRGDDHCQLILRLCQPPSEH